MEPDSITYCQYNNITNTLDFRYLMFFKAPAEKTKVAVKTAVKTGYRMIDCANDYDNEHVIGDAFQELFKEGVVVRYSKIMSGYQ